MDQGILPGKESIKWYSLTISTVSCIKLIAQQTVIFHPFALTLSVSDSRLVKYMIANMIETTLSTSKLCASNLTASA
jgi:hypothetical protein